MAKGYDLPLFPLDKDYIIENYSEELIPNRVTNNMDNGDVQSYPTGTISRRQVPWTFILNDADKLKLERFLSKEFYYDATVDKGDGQGYQPVDPYGITVPDNIDELLLLDPDMLRRGMNQSSGTFQKFDPRDGVYRKYKIKSSLSSNFWMLQWKASFSVEEVPLLDGILLLSYQVEGSDLPVVNDPEGSTVFHIYYKDQLVRSLVLKPGQKTKLTLPPSANYYLEYKDIREKIPVISLAGEEVSSATSVYLEGIEVHVTDGLGNTVEDALMYGADFTDINYPAFFVYATSFPISITTDKYNISKSTSDDVTFTIPYIGNTVQSVSGDVLPVAIYYKGSPFNSTHVAVGTGHTFTPALYNLPAKSVDMVEGDVKYLTWVVPEVTIEVKNTLGTILNVPVLKDGNPVTSGYIDVGADQKFKPSEYNLVEKTLSFLEGDSKTLNWVVPRLKGSWFNEFNVPVDTDLTLDGVVVATDVHTYEDDVACTTHNVELLEYNVSTSVTLAEGETEEFSLTVPATKVNVTDVSDITTYPNGLFVYRGTSLEDTVTYTQNEFIYNEKLNDTINYRVLVTTDDGVKELLTENTAIIGKQELLFEPPVLVLKRTPVSEPIQMKNDASVTETLDFDNPLEEAYFSVNITEPPTLYRVTCNGVIWYEDDTESWTRKKFFIPEGTIVVNVGGVEHAITAVKGNVYEVE